MRCKSTFQSLNLAYRIYRTGIFNFGNDDKHMQFETENVIPDEDFSKLKKLKVRPLSLSGYIVSGKFRENHELLLFGYHRCTSNYQQVPKKRVKTTESPTS